MDSTEEMVKMIKKWNVTLPRLTGEKTRKAYIYLPDSYKKEPDKRYPVLYMFDGHNVFFDADATYGKSWGMNQYMRKAKKQLIIVAVECNHEGNMRLSEYSPVDFESAHFGGKIKGRGKLYMQWLVNTLKPYIDAHYRTLPQREHTYIAGSSMGGLMSLYAAVQFNHVFSKAACLSPSLWTDPAKLLEMIAKAKLGPDTVIYMDYGSNELGNHYGHQANLMTVAQMLMLRNVNVTLRIVPGGDHSEASWEKQIPVFMEILGI